MPWVRSNKKGSGGEIIETVLVDVSSSTTAWASPLSFPSFNLSDYDYIKIEGTSVMDGYWSINPIFDVEDIPITDSAGNGCMSIGGSAFIGNVNNTLYIWTSTGKQTTVNKITGMNKGG